MATYWLAAALILASTFAHAFEFGDFGYGHDEFQTWYETGENGGPLMRPDDPKTRCCYGDCRPTKGRMRNGVWEVWLDRRWWRVPDAKMKTNVTQPNNTAHACASKPYAGEGGKMAIAIHCFIPPKLEN